MKNYKSERQVLLQSARAMNASGLNQGASGNLSLRVDNGFLITPSGLEYDICTPESMVFMTLQGDWTGEIQPSSEWRFHRDIFLEREEAGAIVHAHAHWCTTLACQRLHIPPFHYMIAMAGGATIRCAKYATFGTQALSDNILAALKDRKACLIANHGMLTLQSTLDKALALAVEVEHLARVYSQCLMMGEPVLLSDEEMNKVIEKFKTYGNRT